MAGNFHARAVMWQRARDFLRFCESKKKVHKNSWCSLSHCGAFFGSLAVRRDAGGSVLQGHDLEGKLADSLWFLKTHGTKGKYVSQPSLGLSPRCVEMCWGPACCRFWWGCQLVLFFQFVKPSRCRFADGFRQFGQRNCTARPPGFAKTSFSCCIFRSSSDIFPWSDLMLRFKSIYVLCFGSDLCIRYAVEPQQVFCVQLPNSWLTCRYIGQHLLTTTPLEAQIFGTVLIFLIPSETDFEKGSWWLITAVSMQTIFVL